MHTLLLLVALRAADAHSGGLDRYGCHAGSQPYHCHNGGSTRSAGSRSRSRSSGNPYARDGGSPAADCSVQDGQIQRLQQRVAVYAEEEAAHEQEVSELRRRVGALEDQRIGYAVFFFGAGAVLGALATHHKSRKSAPEQ